MHWIIQFIVQNRNVSSLFFTVFISLFMLTAKPQKQKAMARSLSTTVFFPFQITLHQITRVKTLFDDNKELKQQVARLQTQVAILSEESQENHRLRELIGLDDKFLFELISANTVVREPTFIYRSIIINRGQNHGITKFMPVVNNRGVVGKIIQVMPNISMVQLFRDPSERISVMLKLSGIVGIMGTNNSQSYFVKYRKHTNVSVGDTLVTSGYGGIYPRGLSVGTISKIKDTSDPLFKDVYVNPSVDFEHLEEVFVLKMTPKWTAFRLELDSLVMEQ